MEASIDIGNSRLKVGIFENGVLLESTIKDELSILPYLETMAVDRVMVSSVGGREELIGKLHAGFSDVWEFTRATKLPMEVSYATPDTLGLDRLAAAAGALQRFEGPMLVIDAGSCITCDLISPENIFVGGTISPGLQMRLQAMHTFTDRLPFLEVERPGEGIPDSTKEAMLAGAVIGAKHELIGFINHYRTQFPEIKVILCGGDAKYFDKMNELNIFVLPNLVLEGLNAILRFNGEE